METIKLKPGEKYNITGRGPGIYEKKVPSGYKFTLAVGSTHIEPDLQKITKNVLGRTSEIASGKTANAPVAGHERGGKRHRKTRKSRRRTTRRRR